MIKCGKPPAQSVCSSQHLIKQTALERSEDSVFSFCLFFNKNYFIYIKTLTTEQLGHATSKITYISAAQIFSIVGVILILNWLSLVFLRCVTAHICSKGPFKCAFKESHFSFI